MTELVKYDAMCHAIAAAHSVDEVKDIRDRALAIELYARQAKDTAWETQVREIRLARRKAMRRTAKGYAKEPRRQTIRKPVRKNYRFFCNENA